MNVLYSPANIASSIAIAGSKMPPRKDGTRTVRQSWYPEQTKSFIQAIRSDHGIHRSHPLIRMWIVSSNTVCLKSKDEAIRTRIGMRFGPVYVYVCVLDANRKFDANKSLPIQMNSGISGKTPSEAFFADLEKQFLIERIIITRSP